MRRWRLLSAVGLLLGVATHAAAQIAPQYVGAGSCAASACHGSRGADPAGIGEFTTWITRDSHGQAYEVLFADRSRQIQKNLHQKIDAHEDQRCLRCHVAPEFDNKKPPLEAPYFKSDGVSCESCHGPAKAWIERHHLKSWQNETPAEKKRLGMYDTQSLVSRAQLCVRCHVGEAGMDVDHDLIAAGHPRLSFEFTAFHAAMPRHWPDAKDRERWPAFEYRAWLTGQLVTAQASLALLADRAGDERKPWPEFAEHDCAACHHDLQPGKRTPRPGKLGAIPWSGWNLGMTPRALKAIGAEGDGLAKLRAELDRGWGNRKVIASRSHQAARELKPLLERNTEPVSADVVLRDIIALDFPGAARGRDDATQIALALSALQRYQLDRSVQFPAKDRLAILDFSRGFNPAAFDAKAVRDRLLEFKSRRDRKRGQLETWRQD